MATEVTALIVLDLVSHIKPVDLLQVLSVALTKGTQLIVSLALLRLQARIGVV